MSKTALLVIASGFAASAVGFFCGYYFFSHTHVAAYKMVTIFLTLILMSNIFAKIAVRIIRVA